jgi:phenol hydroxylase P1 protein
MQMDLRTVSITPLRHTFGHLARRMGADKPASRYLEGTMDLQPVENYHYRPTWDPAHDIFDPRHTAIHMKDWYALKDPRQFYYGAWTLARGRMQETTEADFSLVDELGLAASYPDAGRQRALTVLLPLRHVAWAANINNSYVSAYSYGIAISQAAMYATMDQLGVAQYLTRLGLAFNDLDALTDAKQAWLHGHTWQPLRQYVEDLMVEKDWFELLIAHNFVLDGLLYPMIYGNFNDLLNAEYGPVFSMLTRFQREWHAENLKWVDAVIKAAAADNPDNQAQLSGWVRQWRERAQGVLAPLATLAFADQADSILQEVVQQLDARAAKAGLTV